MSDQVTSWRIRQLNSLVKWGTSVLPKRVAQRLLTHLLDYTPNNAAIIQKLEFSIRNQELLHKPSLRQLILAMCDEEHTRGQVVDVLLHYMKSKAPDIDQMQFDLPTQGRVDFENLSGLFAATCLDESIITMNIRQTAYLFGLIRQSNAAKVIEVGRHWGGSTLVIAAAMRGRGEFWSIGDPAQLEHDRGDVFSEGRLRIRLVICAAAWGSTCTYTPASPRTSTSRLGKLIWSSSMATTHTTRRPPTFSDLGRESRWVAPFCWTMRSMTRSTSLDTPPT